MVRGQGIAQVLAIGTNTEIGKIGKALQSVTLETTPLKRQIARMVRNLALVGLFLCVTVVVLYGATRGDWLAGFLAGLTLAMAILPEEFPMVLTVFLALGGWRISKKQVLTRRAPAIETLGEATVLCVDKTGTLTENRMVVAAVSAADTFHSIAPEPKTGIPEQFHELLRAAYFANALNPFDPMEKAIGELAEHALGDTEGLHNGLTLVHEYPLSSGLLTVSYCWKAAGENGYWIAAKGAPEAIAEMCRFDAGRRAALEAEVGRMAAQGLRVLGVAHARFGGAEWPEDPRAFAFTFDGLVGLKDPLRKTVPQAVRECHSAGIRVVMITGDYPGTAQAIAREAGIDGAEQALTGTELAAMSDEQLRERVKTVKVFARVVPEQKLRLVNALKANKEIVAMTGDGVNDAPALKAAHIGIAMGGRGTDVAREASTLVLLNDDFASIVEAVKLGRRIYNNIRHAMGYLLAVHVPIAGMSLVPLLYGWPLMLYPVHILFLEFVIDPACSIAFEAEPAARDVMQRPPRDPRQPLFSGSMLLLNLFEGFIMLLPVWAMYGFALGYGITENTARTLAFTTLVFGNLGLILAYRSRTRTIFAMLRVANPALLWVVAATLAGLALALYVPQGSGLFRFVPLGITDLGLCVVAAGAGVLWFEAMKLIPCARRVMAS